MSWTKIPLNPQNPQNPIGEELGKIFIILCFGMVGTLLFTAQTAVAIRSMVKTENKEVAKAKRATPFLASHFQVRWWK